MPRSHILCPRKYCTAGVTSVTIAELRECGVENVLLDIDNTLVEWHSRDVAPAVHAWIQELKSAGFKLCLVSNTRFGHRLRGLSEELDIPFVRRAFKPSKKGFLNAMQILGANPANTAMIGDQMFTDVLGGNRLGLHTIMVRPLHRREFIGTKVSRMAERVMLAWFRRRGLV